MWNASNEGWPGGWNQGVPETAERLLDRKQRSSAIAIYVVEEDDQLWGFGSLERMHGRDDGAYLALLNVRPARHGQGLGKALILAILQRTMELGCSQLTLGTWPGNLRAVPLYKKCGFCWRPESSVFMQNFIPTLLAMPLAKPFFAAHPWYESFRRDLTVAPDDVRWHDARVYPYRFEAAGQGFAATIDQAAETPCAVETDDLELACWLGVEEVVCGLPHTVTWTIRNKRPAAGPRRVALLAAGDDGIDLRVTESFDVADEQLVERRFTVSPDIELPKRGQPAKAIRSTILVDGVPVTLAIGVKAVQPVEITVGNLRPNVGKPREKVVVTLRSRADQPLRGELVVSPAAGLAWDRTSAPFEVPAKSWTSVELRLTMPREEAATTRLQAVCPAADNPSLDLGGAPLQTRARPFTFRPTPLESVYGWQCDEEEAVGIEAPALRVLLARRGGHLTVVDRASGGPLLAQAMPCLGPPFAAWHHAPPLFDCRLRSEGGRVQVTAVMPSTTLVGLTIEKTITLGAGPYLRVDHRIINTTDQPQQPKLRVDTSANVQSVLTVPLASGLLHEAIEGWGDFPLWDGRDLPKQASAQAESWRAWGGEGVVAGVVWRDAEEVDGLSLQVAVPDVPPRGAIDLDPLYLVAGPGDWQTVRSLWRRLYQDPSHREVHRPTVEPVDSAGFDPAPLLLTAAETTAELVIHGRRSKVREGTWAQSGELQAEPAGGPVTGLDREHPTRATVRLRLADATPRVLTSTVTTTIDAAVQHREERVVLLGDAARPVSVTPGEPWVVDNGRLRFDVAPGHQGSVTSLRSGGVEHLHSSWPTPAPFLWMNPWYGGLCPHLEWPGNPRFERETFAGEAVERVGERGLIWRGVRLTCLPQHRDLRWLRLEVDYLTLGDSNVLLVALRVANLTTAPQSLGVGLSLWPRAAQPTAELRLHRELRRPEYQPAGTAAATLPELRERRGAAYGFQFGAAWAAVENAATGAVLAVVAGPPEGGCRGEHEAGEGFSLAANTWLPLEPGETAERLEWLVLTHSVEQARRHAVLNRVWRLP